MPLGTHTVSVKVTANGCDKVATQTFEIIPAPSSVVIYPPVLQDCETYTIELNAYASGTGTYNWSNGANGSSIIVTEGGAYQVTFTNAGGCSTSYQIVVPKSPKAYMWIFPEGCYTKCKDEVAYLLGPTLPINEWSWLLNQNPISSGSYSVPANLPLSQSGTYNLQLNTGLCDLQSASMYLTAGDCSDCKLEVKEEKLYQNEGTLCTFTLILQITNNMGMDLQASILSNNNNLIVSPGSVTLLQGTHSYTFTVTPINGFLGGNVSMSIIGSYIKETVISCVTKFNLKLPSCGGAQSNSSTVDQKTMAVVGKIR